MEKIKDTSILFSSKCKIKKVSPLNIKYKDVKIKQYTKVTYSGCILDETFSVETMTTHVINKVNSRLRFLFRQNKKYLDIPLHRLLCNSIMQLLFDYACTLGTLTLTKILKNGYKLLRINALDSA